MRSFRAPRIPFDRLTARDRRALRFGALILLPALLYVGAVRPYRAALEDVRERTEVERSLLERELGLVAASDALPAAADDAAERSRVAGMRLVRAPNVPLAEAEITSHIQSVAVMSRVLLQEIRSVEPPRTRGAASQPDGLRPIRLALRGESDLEGVLTLLQRLESSPLLLQIVELSLEPTLEGDPRSGGRRPSGVIQLGVVLTAFVPMDLAGALDGGIDERR